MGLFTLPSVFPVCSFQTFGVFQASVTGHFIGLVKIKTSSHLNACCMSITEGKDVIELFLCTLIYSPHMVATLAGVTAHVNM